MGKITSALRLAVDYLINLISHLADLVGFFEKSQKFLPFDLSDLTLWFSRLISAIFLGGQVIVHLLRGKIHRRNVMEQMVLVGPESITIALVTAIFVGMVFTIQVAKEFINFGATNLVGGVLALALTRELSPVLTAVILAGRVGSAFAAEIGTMQVTEQIDALIMLRTDPIDYLVIPRVLGCCLMLPLLTIISIAVGLSGGLFISIILYNVPTDVFLDSAKSLLKTGDLVAAAIKAVVFGSMIAVIGCSWGLTTTGGAKGVGQSTTTAVVTALLAIFVANFFLSWIMFQGLGSKLFGG
ncbi:MAG: MlaE family lipid ABC transporter permease subunit [Coleofasciculaceae cyanobacterium SM2_1_6]|nr:MlaE family lipid ABC transporter permease subunit [Coleofasciculaceae cyanobacterium SM2_1_6]